MLVIIPSAGKLPSNLESETGSSSHSLIKLDGKPILEHICKIYFDRNCEARFVSIFNQNSKSSVLPNQNIKNHKSIYLPESKSIAHSILFALQDKDKTPDEPLIIHMGDTLIDMPKKLPLDSIFTDKRKDLYKWTVLKNTNGLISVIHDRDPNYFSSIDKSIATGIFIFSSKKFFYEVLKKNLNLKNRKNLNSKDPFFHAIHEYSKIKKMKFVNSKNWLDFGHISGLYESKLKYQNVRHFNQLEFCQITSTVKKTSKYKPQFRNQIKWFDQVPDNLKYFCPRIYESSDGDNPYLVMEMLPFPTLSELFIDKRIEIGEWNSIARSLTEILNRFDRYSFSSDICSSLNYSMYFNKTHERVENFLNQFNDAHLLHVKKDSKSFDLEFVLKKLKVFLDRYDLINYKTLTPIHGDFCFSNLLFDSKSQMTKMIDPRGEFGVPGIYGDKRYDLAKLFHSVSSGYDFIMSGKFNYQLSKSKEISLDINYENYHSKVNDIFNLYFFKSESLKFQVQAIQVLLFLSMLPLHKDNAERQIAMTGVGLNLFANLFKKIDI